MNAEVEVDVEVNAEPVGAVVGCLHQGNATSRESSCVSIIDRDSREQTKGYHSGASLVPIPYELLGTSLLGCMIRIMRKHSSNIPTTTGRRQGEQPRLPVVPQTLGHTESITSSGLVTPRGCNQHKYCTYFPRFCPNLQPSH